VEGGEKGFMKKEALKLTNLRAIRGSQSVMLKDCEKIVTANVQSKSGKSTEDVQFIKQSRPSSLMASTSPNKSHRRPGTPTIKCSP